MGWSHPDISLDQFLQVVKGFIDILVLASGYQSSGRPANWDVHNIKKALQWALFFEEVFKGIANSVGYKDSVEELDRALQELKSAHMVPHALEKLSSSTLSRARELVLERLLQTNPLTDTHLTSLLTAVVDTDISNIGPWNNTVPQLYIERLMQQKELLDPIQVINSIDGSVARSVATDSGVAGGLHRMDHNVGSPGKELNFVSQDSAAVANSWFVIQELLKRKTSMFCISSAGSLIDTILKMVTIKNIVASDGRLLKDELSEFFLWDKWRSKCLAYMLDKRTIRLLSGATLIFQTPKIQWARIFDSLIASADSNDAFSESVELLLMGFISSTWNLVIEQFISHPCDLLPISKQFLEVHNLLLGNSEYIKSEMEHLNSVKKDILEYLTPLLHAQPQKLWDLSPFLVSTTIPLWSTLFAMHLADIEGQLNGTASSIRSCECLQSGNEHRDCELAERIRCLYAYHIQGFRRLVDR